MKKVLMMAAVCLMAAMTFAAQCAATTKKGTQCKRQASPGSEFCWQHGGTTKAERGEGRNSPSPDRKVRQSESEGDEPAPTPKRRVRRSESEEQTSDAPAAKPVRRRPQKTEASAASDAPKPVEGQCAATTKAGTQCRRKAVEGGKYCVQHAGKMGGGESEAPAARPKRARSAKAESEAPAANDAPAVAEGQCQATTKSGAPCKRKAQAGGKYCAQHAAKMGGGESAEPAAKPKRARRAKAEPAAEPAAKPSEPAAASGMCQGKTKSGEPCKRKAKPGSKFCHQHEK